MTLATNKDAQAATILEKAVCLVFRCHYLSNHRRVNSKDVLSADVNDQSPLTVRKQLVDPKELRDCHRIQNRLRDLLRRRALPAHRVFGDSAFLVPLASIQSIDEDLAAGEAELRAEAHALAGRYVSAMARQAAKLGKLFDASDYATPAEVEAAFGVEWSYVSFAAPENLETVDHALAIRAHQEHRARLAQAYHEVLRGLRETALEVVVELEQRLSGDADGQPKLLRGTALRDLRDFQAELPALNLAGDDQLTAVMARIAARTKGLSVESLRDSDQVRHATLVAVAEAKAALSKLVQDAPRRAMGFGGLNAA